MNMWKMVLVGVGVLFGLQYKGEGEEDMGTKDRRGGVSCGCGRSHDVQRQGT